MLYLITNQSNCFEDFILKLGGDSKGPYSFAYENWWKLASGLFNELGEAGRYYFHRLSEMEPEKYNERKADQIFNHSKKYSNITGGSVRWIIRDAGGP